jgi:hypothetical protein
LNTSLDEQLKTSQKRFWSYVKYKTKGQHSSIPALKDEDGNTITDSVEKANLLNLHFHSVFTDEKPASADIPKKTEKQFSLKEIILTKPGIVNLIKKLNKYKSPGPDKISARLLQLVPDEISDYLLLIFKKCFKTGEIPSHWKVANVTPIHKKGSRSSPKNYRPISLTSIVGKLFEHILTSHLATFLEKHSLFNEDQFGFRKKRSCELQLHRVCQDIAFCLDNGEEADLVFLDFSKAFDKVPHKLLLQKLKSYGMQEDVTQLISSFLSNRTQKVVIDGVESDTVPVTSGVPQGSVIGPLLFIIYINDLPDKIKSKCRLFADDSLLYRKIKSERDKQELQLDLEEVINWCNAWQMELNVEKCEHMHISSKRAPDQNTYTLSDHHLSTVSSYKYLGLHLQNDLNWNKHINEIVSKANKVLYTTKLALNKSTTQVKTAAYKTMIRPLVEYSSSVWDPYTSGQINCVEKIQRKAARFCLNRYHQTDSVTKMIEKLNWKSLAQRRRAARLAVFSRVFNQEDCLSDLSSLITRAPLQNLRHVHPYRLKSMTCHKNVGQNSFVPRSIREWNSLPRDFFAGPVLASPAAFRSAILNGVKLFQ